MHNQSYGVYPVRVANATVAGTTAIKSTGVDMNACGTPCQGVRAIALLGALTANQVTRLKLQHSDDDVDGNYVDVASTGTPYAADADGNKLLITDLFKPRKRYVRAVLERGTANAVLDGIIIELYLPQMKPTPLSATVSGRAIVNSKDTGTA
jgi:hypothetical protein